MTTTTEKIKDTLGLAADKLKYVVHNAADKVKHAARDAADYVSVVADDMPNKATAERTVILEHEFLASPEQLFKAWTDPEIAGSWFGPEGYYATNIEMDVRVGGRWAHTLVSPEGKRYPMAGVYREVVAPEHLLLFDEGKGEPTNGHATKIEVTFEPTGLGTQMHLMHGVFQTVELRDQCKAGWISSLKRLERILRET